MGGNGTYALGKDIPYAWQTIGTINGVKILEPKQGGHKLPEESHTSRMYILQHPQDGNFAQLRIYDRHHRLRFELGYHPERSLDRTGKPILHYHKYTHPGFKRTAATKATKRIYEQFKQYLKGVKFDEEQ